MWLGCMRLAPGARRPTAGNPARIQRSELISRRGRYHDRHHVLSEETSVIQFKELGFRMVLNPYVIDTRIEPLRGDLMRCSPSVIPRKNGSSEGGRTMTREKRRENVVILTGPLSSVGLTVRKREPRYGLYTLRSTQTGRRSFLRFPLPDFRFATDWKVVK